MTRGVRMLPVYHSGCHRVEAPGSRNSGRELLSTSADESDLPGASKPADHILSSVPIIDDNPARFFDFFLPDSFCAACEPFAASAVFTSQLLLVGVYSVGIAILHGSLLSFKS